MTQRIFAGALSDEIARVEGRGDDRQYLVLLRQSASGMLELIRDGLIRDGSVRLHHFGTFRLKPVAARKGVNPRTGEPLMIPAHRRVVFTPAKALLDRIEPQRPAPRPLPAPPVSMQEPTQVADRTAPHPVFRPDPAPVVTPQAAATQPATAARRQQPHWLIAAALVVAVVLLLALWQWPARQQTASPTVAAHAPAPTPQGAEPASPPPTAPRPAANQQVAAAPRPAPENPSPVAMSATPAATSTATESETPPAAAAVAPHAVPAPFFAQRGYTVAQGDSLWRLSAQHYQEPILWPHIYRANHRRVRNPDLIYPGDALTLPELQGPPQALSAVDRERIAEGYFLLYQRYEAQHRHDAIYALIGARWFDPAVYERHRPDVNHQRLRIMELAPLYGDRVPRLLAATFNPGK